MRAVCRVLASIAILVGTLFFMQGIMRGNRDAEAAGFIGAILFGAGLLSLTILTASEPRWPEDDRARRLGNKRYSDDDEYR
jgi:hypothetical protein